VINPATGNSICEIVLPPSIPTSVKTQITNADIAYKKFKLSPSTFRAKLLIDWASEIRSNKDEIAKIMTMESGKPLHESLGEIEYGCTYLDFYAGEALRPTSSGGGSIIPSGFSSKSDPLIARGKMLTFNEGVGVCGFITPWNFPFAMITRKVGPAIAAGCTVVIKPSELTFL